MKQVVQFGLLCYKRLISPMLPHACRFVPTCSEYAMEAIELHGVFRGSLLALKRLLRCHPFAKAGLDPVPKERALTATDARALTEPDSCPLTGGAKLQSYY